MYGTQRNEAHTYHWQIDFRLASGGLHMHSLQSSDYIQSLAIHRAGRGESPCVSPVSGILSGCADPNLYCPAVKGSS